ncbi:hypothetical protein HanXRQr2_Chr02g0085711 [Helianthus annuus]|uniref:Uncharacterized protein n=1 Tax=Helianthus annuus TaxID=4232 RepID=A0A9K3JS25_HELAN|nr:hypothetical protein HanXRQr2_Chr02g0085711 [Helianthus annuus]
MLAYASHDKVVWESTLGFTDPSQAIGLAVIDSNPAPIPIHKQSKSFRK